MSNPSKLTKFSKIIGLILDKKINKNLKRVKSYLKMTSKKNRLYSIK